MDVTPLVRAGQQIIQSYANGGFRISGQIYHGAVLVQPEGTVLWDASSFEDMTLASFESLISLPEKPDVVLLGTGSAQKFLPRDLKQALREGGLVIEVMDTGAACRTYNVLVAEGRRVACLLLPAQ
ncbi:MAG: Mth938-like domain-containing protein [Micavibrio sp.]